MLTADQTNIKLGELPYGQPYQFKFRVINSSSELINIQKLVLGCGSCTKASINKNNLAPNESTFIDTIFTPGSTGIQSKTINVIYKEGEEEKTLVLNFNATIKK